MGENAEREADGGDALPEWEQVSSRAAAASGGRVSASVFVVPSSVVLVWNQVSLAMREEGELKEIEKSGCDMDVRWGWLDSI